MHVGSIPLDPLARCGGRSVLDDFYWINKDHPNYSLRRTTHNRGEAYPTDGQMLLSPQAQGEVMKLFFTRNEDLYDKEFSEFVGEDFFRSNFWVYWQSMIAIAPWHGALEMKLYMNRFVHLFGGFADLSMRQVDPPEPVRLPGPPAAHLARAARRHDRVRHAGHQRPVRHRPGAQGGAPHRMAARRTSAAASTSPRTTSSSSPTAPPSRAPRGGTTTPRPSGTREIREGSIWAMWRNIAAQDPAFGRPDKFCTHTDKSSYESACIRTLDDKIPAYIERICQRDPFLFDGNIVTGGLVTVRDSPWLLSGTSNGNRTSGTSRTTSS